MHFNKAATVFFLIKRISGLSALALSLSAVNLGCQVMQIDEGGITGNNFKQWVVSAEQLREQGDLIGAQEKLNLALQAVKDSNISPSDHAAVELAVGYNLFLLNRLNAAEQHLQAAYPKAVGNIYLQALADQYLANLYFASGESKQALSHVDHGLNLLQAGDHPGLRLSLELLAWGVSPDGSAEKAQKLLSLAARIEKLPYGLVKSKLGLKTAQLAVGLKAQALPGGVIADLQQQSYQLLNPLLSQGYRLTQPRLAAEAIGTMAELYQWQGRLQEALALSKQAITLAEAVNQRELLTKLAAQSGDLYRSLGDDERALAAYDAAVNNLYSIRVEMPISMPDGRSVLNTLIDPIYRTYVDLLLQSKGATEPAQSDQLLAKAIDSMEAIKEADMQDFFLGRCSIGTQNGHNWQQLSLADAAIFYPILLKDRVELLLKTDRGIVRHTVKVPVEQIRQQAEALVKALQHGKDYRSASKQLYEWLFAPVKDELQHAQPGVILYVPDRSLRSVPLAALNDGRTFVIEQYGIVTLPGLSLNSLSATETRKLPESRVLLAGLSRPDGASIDQLPAEITGQLSDGPLSREAIIEELSLPSVEEEIRKVAEKAKTTTLLNNEFTAAALMTDIERGDYGKVHIASHGYFGKNARESFIMAYDQNMSLLEIKDTLEVDTLKTKPIDLLTLSACRTAEGNDSILLGFSGLAVKSNVLSAIGSLWSINDDATMEFMRLFYDGLAESNNKSLAMRKAQVAMIKNKEFRHPFFWAPFILIGDWQ
jgi:CHAT domain-containing protein